MPGRTRRLTCSEWQETGGYGKQVFVTLLSIGESGSRVPTSLQLSLCARNYKFGSYTYHTSADLSVSRIY